MLPRMSQVLADFVAKVGETEQGATAAAIF
jgi:hypothetical protein